MNSLLNYIKNMIAKGIVLDSEGYEEEERKDETVYQRWLRLLDLILKMVIKDGKPRVNPAQVEVYGPLLLIYHQYALSRKDFQEAAAIETLMRKNIEQSAAPNKNHMVADLSLQKLKRTLAEGLDFERCYRDCLHLRDFASKFSLPVIHIECQLLIVEVHLRIGDLEQAMLQSAVAIECLQTNLKDSQKYYHVKAHLLKCEIQQSLDELALTDCLVDLRALAHDVELSASYTLKLKFHVLLAK